MTKTILLADDSLTIQKVVELTFADTPYNVVAVSTGDELLDKLPEVKPELIVCDIIMPGRDGYDVCQEIKSSPDTLHIPVILLSGTFEPLDRDRALAVGCSEILTKPFEARKLIDTVERLLRRRDEAESATTADAARRRAETGPVSVGDAGRPAFGTRLSPTAEAEFQMTADDMSTPGGEVSAGIDFTETGFAEMEAAAANASDRRADMPADGLEFEVGAAGSDVDPFADFDAEPADRTEQEDFAAAFDAGNEPFAAVADEIDDVNETGAVFETPRSSEAESAAAPRDPSEATDVETALEAETEIEDAATVDERDLDGGIGEFIEEPAFQLQSAENAFGGGSSFTTDADTAPLPPLATPTQQPVEASSVEAPAVAGRLSDDDIDRIARRLLELADEKIEQIAWEVIPDVAEIVVRERIRRLEAELETEN